MRLNVAISDAENVLLESSRDDLMESSVKISQLWKEEFVISEDQKTNDLVFIQFDKEGQEYFCFLAYCSQGQFDSFFGR